MGTGRPGTAGVDEYQALQLLDEGVVKRGVSDRKMRSFPETPGPLLTRNKKHIAMRLQEVECGSKIKLNFC